MAREEFETSTSSLLDAGTTGDRRVEIAAHTALPWRLSGTSVIRADKHNWIANVSWRNREANAAFIVRAVNVHDELVAALRLACTQAVRDANWDKPPQSKWYYAAKAALAKATSADGLITSSEHQSNEEDV